MSKQKKNIKPLLLTAAIIGFVVVFICVFAAICRWERNKGPEHEILSTTLVYNSHILSGALIIIAFALAMVFIGFRKDYTTNSKLLSTKVLIILNAVFWGLAMVATAIGTLQVLDVTEIGGLSDKEFMPIIWVIMATLTLPISIIDTIAFVKGK